MESIFADTARTTLAEQLSAGDTDAMPNPGSSGGGNVAFREKINGTPEEVFGEEATSRWANLAFMDVPAKKTA